jgi:hypothetical protein
VPLRRALRSQTARRPRGTSGKDTITGTDSGDVIKALAGNDTIKGRDGNDFLFGNDGNDTLTEGRSSTSVFTSSFVCGGAGDDDLKGGFGRDQYVFDDGWGQDTVLGEENYSQDDILDFTGCSVMDTLQPVTANLTIDLTAGKTFETAAGEGGVNAVTWTAGAIEAASGGAGNDTITGSAGYNELYGLTGDDTIHAADNGDDYVNCEEGTDTAIVDAEDFVSSSCKTKTVMP